MPGLLLAAKEAGRCRMPNYQADSVTDDGRGITKSRWWGEDNYKIPSRVRLRRRLAAMEGSQIGRTNNEQWIRRAGPLD